MSSSIVMSNICVLFGWGCDEGPGGRFVCELAAALLDDILGTVGGGGDGEGPAASGGLWGCV